MKSLMILTVFERALPSMMRSRDGDGEIVRAAAHVDVRRIVVEGVDVNQEALYDEY